MMDEYTQINHLSLYVIRPMQDVKEMANVSGCLVPLSSNMCSIRLPLRPLDRAYTFCRLLTKY